MLPPLELAVRLRDELFSATAGLLLVALVGASRDESGEGLSSRKAKSSSLLMCFLFFLAHAMTSFVLFLCPYLVPDSIVCLHTSEAPVQARVPTETLVNDFPNKK